MLSMEEKQDGSIHSDDRILVLKQIEGAPILNGAGAPDPRLFKGGNNIHVYQAKQSTIWKFRYDIGGLPEPLKQGFTRYQQAYDFAKDYFEKRGVYIEKVIDA